MYYPLYNNPFYYPTGAYINNMCSYGYAQNTNTTHTSNSTNTFNVSNETLNATSFTRNDSDYANNTIGNDFFSINGDRLEVFGISINIDDLIILVMLFFMFRENQIDYSIIIILALILFDQS